MSLGRSRTPVAKSTAPASRKDRGAPLGEFATAAANRRKPCSPFFSGVAGAEKQPLRITRRHFLQRIDLFCQPAELF